MFYEPASDYFYDPKTKLYYSNKKRAYFTLIKEGGGGGDVEFREVVQHGNTGGGGATTSPTWAPATGNNDATNPQVNSNEIGAGGDKTKIAIALKTTTLPSTADKTASVAAASRLKLIEKLRKASSATANISSNNAPSEPQVHKKHAKDLDVWSNRIKEMKGEIQDPAAAVVGAPSSSSSSSRQLQSSSDNTTPTTVKTTASGQPICVLCRRKFANIEKLRQHEQLSALHKDNLAKKAAAAEKAKAAETTYRDRTKERQLLYSGSSSTDTKHVDRLLSSVTNPKTDAKTTTVIRPEEMLGDDNVGNQMMQKMGWKSGNALGRKQEDGGGDNTAESKVGSNATDSLKNEWARIESLAQSGGQSRGRR